MMHCATSAKFKHYTKGNERIPLSVINGNQKPQRKKDFLENLFPSVFQTSSAKSSAPLTFSIFPDNATEVTTVSEICTEKEEFIDIDTCRNDKQKYPSVFGENSRECESLYSFTECNDEDENCFSRTNDDDENCSFSTSDEKENSITRSNNYLEFTFPYKRENFHHLKELEGKYRVSVDNMTDQKELTIGMRTTLVDWLIEVGCHFKFGSETVHLAVSLVDRMMSCSNIPKSKYQLVGICCLFISAKYEEVDPLELSQYIYITDETYSQQQLLQMERIIFQRLEFYVGGPTALLFAYLASSMVKTSEKLRYMTEYLCELALLDISSVSYLPSEIGVAAYCLARYFLAEPMWVEELNLTGFTLKDLILPIQHLFKVNTEIKNSQFQQVIEKYSHPDYLRVSEVVLPQVLIIV